MINNPDHPIVFFDGVCNLCTQSVQFIIRRDPEQKFRFASLQSEFGQQVLKHFNLPVTRLNTLILLHDGKIYRKSTAALRIANELSGAWSALYALAIIPAFIRDPVYDLIARNRYKWFGKQAHCMIPSPQLKDLFIN
ncbi:MAG: thiol-disulfide oxidoreductase DCC family protein [Sphingobacteriia bacterium]|nr:thiol-disulfide oxidoreductase DCC family protein [Sphingobacteriia bacterium]